MTCTHIARTALAAATLALLLATSAQALTPGQTDSFEDGTTLGWGAGPNHPLPPLVMTTGGPGGAGDPYLLLQAVGGSVPGGRLAAENRLQWAGDYTAAGITALTLDAFNLGQTDLSLRLLFDVDGLAGADRAWSSVPLLLPAGSGWQGLRFSVTAADLTAVAGSDVDFVLANTRAIRLFHGAASSFPGETISAMVGVDNVTAVPEPASALLLALGLGLGLLHRRRRPAGEAR